jgi:cytochrome c oxidase subunit 4
MLSYKQLLSVLAILIALTAITILASKIDLGPLNIWMALLIASVKSSFVLLYFMHLKYEHKVFMITFLITVFTVAILIGFMFWDIAWRYA